MNTGASRSFWRRWTSWSIPASSCGRVDCWNNLSLSIGRRIAALDVWTQHASAWSQGNGEQCNYVSPETNMLTRW
jgi:hypothetical protein